jgi:F0F1-type ATP synthase assembly protein I
LATEDPNRQVSRPPRKDSAYNMAGTFTVLDSVARVIAAPAVGGLIGYFVDRWLHTDPIFTLTLGALGLAAGITDLIRRLLKQEKREEKERDGS